MIGIMEVEMLYSTNQINDRSISKIEKKMLIFIKFGQSEMMRECQPGTLSAKPAG